MLHAGYLDKLRIIHDLKERLWYYYDIRALVLEYQLHLLMFNIRVRVIDDELPLSSSLPHHYVMTALTVQLRPIAATTPCRLARL